MEILVFVVGLVVGGVGCWYALRMKFSGELHKTQMLEKQLHDVKLELDRERAQAMDAKRALATAEANYKNLQDKLKDQRGELESLQEKFTLQFKNLANEIFEEKTKKFTDQNKSNLYDLLKPLGEKIVDFERKVEETHKDSISRNSALREQLENLQKLNLQMTKEAENLTKALKGDSQKQGAWGEFILESILEKSGLERDREYFIQESFTTSQGRLRPDVIVRLPENRHVVIDSKVSLTAYDTFVNSTTEQEKLPALKAHLVSIRQHMKGLSEKNYQRNISENGLDFIIMFIPIEPAYILAIQSEKSLYDEALEKRIVFVSPSLLIPALQLIKNAWKQEYQNRHVLDIANKAGDLYDKFVGFTEDLISMGRHLDSSKKYYEESMKKLSIGSGNLVRRVEDLRKLGARASKNIDPGLLKRSEDQGDLFEN